MRCSPEAEQARIVVVATPPSQHHGVMPAPSGFTYATNTDGSITIDHRGRTAATLRGSRAVAFLAEIAGTDEQLVMARWTGNYRRGNERTAKQHPRNARRR